MVKCPLSFAVIAGGLLALAFAPTHWALFALIAPVILYAFIRNTRPKRAFFLGWLFGVGLFGVGLSWIAVSFENFGGLPTVVAISLTAVFVALMACFYGALGLATHGLRPATPSEAPTSSRTPHRLLPHLNAAQFAALWSGCEWLRAHLWVGLPWLLIGDSQLTTPFAGFLPVLGLWGTSFILIFCVTLAYEGARSRRWDLIGLSVVLMALGGYLQTLSWTTPTHTLNIAAIQANITHQQKWDANFIQANLHRYQQRTQALLTSTPSAPDLIIWPENAVPLPQTVMQDFLQTQQTWLETYHSNLLLGMSAAAPKQAQHFVNRLRLIGQSHGYYDKQHLLPLGEFMPLERTLSPLFTTLGIPLPDYVPGTTQSPPLMIHHLRILPFICYDIAFTHRLREFAGNSALLVTASDDSWFGHSFAAAQHLQVARVRSLLSGRPMIFATNTGRTAAIDAHGQILRALPPFRASTLRLTLAGQQGLTPWVRWGEWPWLGLLVATFLLKIYSARRQYAT